MTLFTIYETVKESINKGKVIIGIGKDTYVTDITRSIIPLSNSLNLAQKIFFIIGRLDYKKSRGLGSPL